MYKNGNIFYFIEENHFYVISCNLYIHKSEFAFKRQHMAKLDNRYSLQL